MPSRRCPTASDLNQPWQQVRQTLLVRCGLLHTASQVDAPTSHCFNDANHMECCRPSSTATYANTNADGAAPNISTHNALPLAKYNGAWCTCQSGQVCAKQFHTRPQWTAVWVGKVLVIAVDGVPKVAGQPTGTLPSAHERAQSLHYYTAQHHGFEKRARAWIASRKKRRSRKPRRPRKQVKSVEQGTKVPLCTALNPNTKRARGTPATTTCRRPSTQQEMPFPRIYSYNECKALRKSGTMGSTQRASCASYD